MNGPIVLLAVVLASAVQGEEAAPRFYQMKDDAQLDDLVRESVRGKRSLQSRLYAVSERFLGTPYRLGPLGEGPEGEFDRDPLVNFTEADCTTFVETVMALAIAGELPRGLDALRHIRYKDGVVRYELRNHFLETDWIANNAAAGFVRDITREVAGEGARTVHKRIKKSEWYAVKAAADLAGFDAAPEAKREELVLRWRELGKALPDQEVELPYLPIENLPELLPKIPSGTIANLIRDAKDDVPIVVSHQIFIFDTPKGKTVRHAAYGKFVEDVPALEYFYRYYGSKWRLLGLNLNAVLDPGNEVRNGR